jgi:hypothetical protein
MAYTLSLAERLCATDQHWPLAGHFLRAATVYITEERRAESRFLAAGLALDTLGADQPHLVTHEIPLPQHTPAARVLEDLAPLRRTPRHGRKLATRSA